MNNEQIQKDEELLTNYEANYGHLLLNFYNNIRASDGKTAKSIQASNIDINFAYDKLIEFNKVLLSAKERLVKSECVEIVKTLKHVEPLGPTRSMDGLISWADKNWEIERVVEKILSNNKSE